MVYADKLSIKEKFKELGEGLLLTFIFLVIFLPVRLVFYEYISQDWLGSVGVITAISITILVLAKKDKLKGFGRLYIKHLTKVHKGKRKFLVYANLTFFTIFFLTVSLGIELGMTQYYEQVYEVYYLLPQEQQTMDMSQQSLDTLQESLDETTPQDVFLALFVLLWITLTNFEALAIFLAVMNIVSQGWLQHISTVYLVEIIEVVGLLTYTKFTLAR